MTKAFLDSSALYSAILSPNGAARELLRWHISGEVTLVVSEYVLAEVRQNLTNKAPNHISAIEIVIDLLSFEIAIVTTKQVEEAATYTELKDAPVVAAAISAECTYLLTFDRKHLIEPEAIAQQSKLKIITPGDLLQILRK